VLTERVRPAGVAGRVRQLRGHDLQINRQASSSRRTWALDEAAAAAISAYDPDETWTPTDDGF
jgi:hypothetical protein